MSDPLEPCLCDHGYCWTTSFPDGGKPNRRCIHEDYRDIIESQAAAIEALTAERDVLKQAVGIIDWVDTERQIKELEAERDRHKGLSEVYESNWVACRERDAYRAERDELRERLRWIPCSERLPRDYDVVIVKGGIAHRYKDAWYSLTQCKYPGRLMQWEVTHWLPLPPPPEQESGG